MQQAYVPKPTSTHFRRHFVKRASLLNSVSCQASLRELSLVPRPHPQKERGPRVFLLVGGVWARDYARARLHAETTPAERSRHDMFRFVSFPGSIPGCSVWYARIIIRSCATARVPGMGHVNLLTPPSYGRPIGRRGAAPLR